MKQRCLSLLVACLLTQGVSTGAQPDPEAFADPPIAARPHAYWDWINGLFTHEQLTIDLEEMKDKGMGGAMMWDTGALRNPGGMVPAGPPFLGPESVAAMQHALREGKRLGLELGLLTSSGWNAGGAWVTPEFAGKNLYVAELPIAGGQKVSEPLPFPAVPEHCPLGPDGLPRFWRDVAVLAIPDREDRSLRELDEVRDLAPHVRDGVLTWDVPPGPWRVLRFVCTNNGQQLIAPSPNSI